VAQGVVWCGLSRWAGQGWSVSGTTWMGPECRQGSDGGGSSGWAGPGCRTDWSGLGRAGASRPGRAGTGGAGMSQTQVGGFGTACRGRHDPDGLGGEWRVGRPGGLAGLGPVCRRGQRRFGMNRRVGEDRKGQAWIVEFGRVWAVDAGLAWDVTAWVVGMAGHGSSGWAGYGQGEGMGSRCRIGMGRHGLGRRNGRGRTGVSSGEARQGPGREPARVGTSA